MAGLLTLPDGAPLLVVAGGVLGYPAIWEIAFPPEATDATPLEALREQYVLDVIDLDEFERRLPDVLARTA